MLDLTTKTDKKPIMPKLKKLGVGEKECYPIGRYGSVKTIVHVISCTTGKAFTTKKMSGKICVTRTK